MNVSGHVVDDEPENVVSDEPALAVRLQHEALREGLRGIVVRLKERTHLMQPLNQQLVVADVKSVKHFKQSGYNWIDRWLAS